MQNQRQHDILIKKIYFVLKQEESSQANRNL